MFRSGRLSLRPPPMAQLRNAVNLRKRCSVMTTTVPDSVALAARPSVERLRVKIFADGANLAGMVDLARNPSIAGFTTNPTLMRAVGVTDYRAFAHEVLAAIPDRPISFEVFSDELDEMERQAHQIASWGEQVYVKIPVSNTLAS